MNTPCWKCIHRAGLGCMKLQRYPITEQEFYMKQDCKHFEE